ncbi:MAG TPA: alpha/beta fold hydrolase [Solirubrobacteraceae bacterium]|nr:alpha/beta fold hydrolase [Solirubrobacteraceae bacterium]
MDVYGPSGRSAWLDVDWSAHRRSVVVDGRRVNLVEIGSGAPLLFVHGLGGSWANWLENVCFFAADRRVVALDLPGFGASELPREPISIAGYARMLDALCSSLGIDAAAVVGNSMGGFVAAELAITYPQRVERLALVSAAGLSIERLRLERLLRRLARIERIVALYGGVVASQSELLARRAGLRRLALAAIAAHPGRLPAPLVSEQIAGAGRPGLLPALRAMSAYPLRDRLGEIVCPTLVVWGERDRLVPVRDASEFERLIAGSRRIVYPDTGHVPMLERPDCFNEDLRAFLLDEEGLPAGSG